jgi:hypothetical protein
MGTLSYSSSVFDTVRKLAGEGTYSVFFVVVMPNSGVPSFSDLPGNCVGPSLSVSSKLGVTPLALSWLLKRLGDCVYCSRRICSRS